MDATVVMEKALSRRQAMLQAMLPGDSKIQSYYCNSTIFVTGGTGFLGKQLVEKLLRSCKIKKMYILIRSRKGMDVHQRLAEMLKDPVYGLLHEAYPGFEDHLIPVEGDVSHIRLGLSDEDWKTIAEEVNMIFHAAATVRFDEPLKKAVLINVRGTKEVMELAKACKKLRSLVHVSTAYSHATDNRIGKNVCDRFYTTPIPPDTLIQLVESVDEVTIQRITHELLAGWPNTYSFSKAVAEEVIRVYGDDLPVCIVRPTIVIEAYQEPLPGWIDKSSVFGPSGLPFGCLKGVVHVVYSDQKIKIDFVPVDFVNNAIIAAGWQAGTLGVTRVLNITSARKGMIWADLTHSLTYAMKSFSSPKATWLCFTLQSSNYYVHLLYTIIFHYIPAYVIDGGAMLFGKRPGFVKLYKKIYKMSVVLRYYTTNGWLFKDENTVNLLKTMSKTDRLIYNFNIMDINMPELVVLWILGLRKFVLKDGLTNAKDGLKKQQKYLFITCFVLFVVFYGVYLLISLFL